MSRLRAAVVQLCSGVDITANLADIECLVMDHRGIDIAVLPECFALLGGPQSVAAEKADKIMAWMASLARKLGCWLVGGALPIPDDKDPRSHAACLVYSPDGEKVASYNKIHLFDAEVSDSMGSYQESSEFIPGHRPTLVETGVASIGLSICYDLRFPELFRHLVRQGANILTTPAAFTRVTGVAHWEPLLRARAIENQCFVLAANQAGIHPDGRQTHGHSMIVSPWGTVLAEGPGEGAAVVVAELDLEEQAGIRRRMPCLHHRKFRGG